MGTSPSLEIVYPCVTVVIITPEFFVEYKININIFVTHFIIIYWVHIGFTWECEVGAFLNYHNWRLKTKKRWRASRIFLGKGVLKLMENFILSSHQIIVIKIFQLWGSFLVWSCPLNWCTCTTAIRITLSNCVFDVPLYPSKLDFFISIDLGNEC